MVIYAKNIDKYVFKNKNRVEICGKLRCLNGSEFCEFCSDQSITVFLVTLSGAEPCTMRQQVCESCAQVLPEDAGSVKALYLRPGCWMSLEGNQRRKS